MRGQMQMHPQSKRSAYVNLRSVAATYTRQILTHDQLLSTTSEKLAIRTNDAVNAVHVSLVCATAHLPLRSAVC
jgi:hypothetical protein